jgi:tetratricopeptide (TPR) repeat protein
VETCYFEAMRGAGTAGFLFLFVSGCWFQQSSSPEGKDAAGQPPAPSGVPAWAPPLTPEQEALLAPVDHAIQTPAARIFPDLARFGYAQNRKLENLEEAVKFTRMVTKVLDDSPRFYQLTEAPPTAANPVLQYGPPAAGPDGFSVVKRDAQGLGEIVPAPGADEARAALAQAQKLEDAGDLPGAIEALKTALTGAPTVPALRLALAGALAKAGRTADAETAYRETVAADPSFAPAHIALADLADRRNDLPALRREVVEALAYDPASTRGLELAHKLTGPGEVRKPSAADGGWIDPPPPSASGGGGGSGRFPPFEVFVDVDKMGAIHVGTARNEAAQIYGGCRAVMRFEPDLRARIFQQPAETPYYLSAVEEVVCLEAAIGAYAAARGDKQGRADASLDRLVTLAQEEGLSGYVMFEILGRRRPERARAAPPEVHRDIAGYVERHVLGHHRDALPEGIYTAGR